MGQAEIIDLLKREERELTLRDIAEQLKQSKTLVGRSVKVLVDNSEIKYKLIPHDKAYKIYRSKRRLMVYYI